MTTLKIHEYKNKRVWYSREGAKWVVEVESQLYTFRKVKDLLSSFPELINVEAISSANARLNYRVDKQKFKKILSGANFDYKSITEKKTIHSYYCSGVGKLSNGMTCENCSGNGSIVVSSHRIDL